MIIVVISFGVSFIYFKFYSSSYSGVVIETKDNYFIFMSKLERIYVYSKSHKYEVGDILTISGLKEKCNFITLESSFNFNDYLYSKGVIDQITVDEIKEVFLNPLRLRNYINTTLSKYNTDTSNLIKNLLFSTGESSEIKTSLKYLHLSRLLSLSGVYINIFISGLTYLLSFKLKDKWAKLIAIILLSIYLIFAFPRFTIIRIFTLLVFRWINDNLLNKKYDNFSILGITASIFLIFNYHLAYQDSFILGYFIPLTSYLLNGSIKIKKKIVKKVVMAILILISLIPFEVKYYNSINLLLYPLQIVITPLFIVYGFFSLLSIFSLPLAVFMNSYTTFLINFANAMKNYAFFINLPSLTTFGFLIFESLFFLTIYYKLIYFYPIYHCLILISVLISMIYVIPFKNLTTSEVSFINVGQGDSCLIRNKITSILIDTGGSIYNDIANNVLIPYLKSKRIYNLDLVITTHDDYDHSGAFGNLKNNMKVKKYISSYLDFPYTINGITLTNYNTYKDVWYEENDESLVIGFMMKNDNYLIMGDAPIKIEKLIVDDNKDLKCDILKVGHHGSNTSTSEDFIKTLKPKEGIISVGKNYYGHPVDSVLQILNKYSVKIRRTDKEGTISYLY